MQRGIVVSAPCFCHLGDCNDPDVNLESPTPVRVCRKAVNNLMTALNAKHSAVMNNVRNASGVCFGWASHGVAYSNTMSLEDLYNKMTGLSATIKYKDVNYRLDFTVLSTRFEDSVAKCDVRLHVYPIRVKL